MMRDWKLAPLNLCPGPIWNAVRILLAALAVLAAANAGTWEIGTVDGAIGGSFSSLKIDTFGNAHVAYVAESGGILQYSFWDHRLRKWFTTNLDQATGFCTLVLDSKQRPHISYPQFGNLKYAYWDGSAWQKQSVQVPSKETTFYTSIALSPGDNPSISYYENISGSAEQMLRLRIVARNSNYWELVTVDQQRGSGKFNSLAIDSAGRPHVAYGNVQYENASLRYAYWDGTQWNKQILEGAGVPGTYRQAVMLFLDKHDIPHIAYLDTLTLIVKYATQVHGKWELHSIDSIGSAAYPDRNGIALDEQGTPYISYYDAKIGVLKVAYPQQQKWMTEVVDSGFAGFTSSLQIYDGTIWVTYSGGPAAPLRFARRSLPKPPVPDARSQARSEPK